MSRSLLLWFLLFLLLLPPLPVLLADPGAPTPAPGHLCPLRP
uniref:Prostaglandin-endoperoxide synthase 1 n=1 Tax=Homo sapiens TaxID=9606 RepID=A0A2R8Y6S0_HUMAN